MDTFARQLISIRRKIHQYPELGNQEFRTSQLVEQVLNKAGIQTKKYAKTGIVGILEGTKAGKARKTIALRADLDALPIREKTGKSYASKRPGIMHACGHDANTTMALGAALILAREREAYEGTVKLVFQPNEESSGGAHDMIAAGVLEHPKVDSIVGMHVSPWLPPGVLGLKYGAMMAAVDRFTIDIIANGGHGAYPHLGKDAIVIAGHIVTALQAVVAREIDPVEPAVITVGTIAGGERYNILCGSVSMTGTVRTLSKRLHVTMAKRIEEKLKGITVAFGATYRFTYEELGCPLVNSPDILELCRASGEAVLGRRKITILEKPSMGGEDFADYLRLVPGCFMYLGTSTGKAYPWHHEKFDIDEQVLPRGAELLADIAKRYLNK
jgi:amidohydrolase